jgi:hypothetical protein
MRIATREQAIEDLRMFGIKEPYTYLLDIIPLVEMIWRKGALQSENLVKEKKMKIPNYRRITLPRKRLRAVGNIKTIHTVPLVLLVLCFSMIPNLCFGESWISLHPEEASVSIPTENELIQTDKEIVQNFAMAPSEPAEEETGAEEIP